MSRPYSEALETRPAVSYITYTTYDNITFAQFEEGILLENNNKLDKDKSISDSIDESSVDYNYDEMVSTYIQTSIQEILN